MKYSKFLVILLLVGFFSSCNKKFDQLLVDPSSPTPEAADVDAFLNQAEISFSGFYTAASDFGGALSRQQALTSGFLYENAYSPQSYDGIWTTAYTGIVKHVDAMIPLAEAQKKYVQEGIGKLLKAYAMATLVDDFGDIPYSESDLGLANINPKTDAGKDVYAAVLVLIDDAITNLNNPDAADGTKTDLFYNGSIAKWTTFANTLKLKMYMQERLVFPGAAAAITALETDNDLINSSSQDFQFQYGKNTSSPDTRHPKYTDNYLGGGAADYICNQFMYKVAAEKSGGAVSSLDPRRRYYFYRQVSDYSAANSQTAPCVTQTRPPWYTDEMPFCVNEVGSGYWGRDHGDATGVGPDNYDRTTWGLYPAGGEFDESLFAAISTTDLGAGGKGIDPIWLSSYTYFLEAEAAIALGITVNGDAKTLLEEGIRASISKVLGFPTQILYPINANYIPTQASVDAYVTKVLSNYDNAETDQEHLDIIMNEYFIALWGNGVEPYNNLRRTGMPLNLQYMVTTPNPGFFIRSYFYPSVFVNTNANAPVQKSPGKTVQKVFWDNNPDDFIK